MSNCISFNQTLPRGFGFGTGVGAPLVTAVVDVALDDAGVVGAGVDAAAVVDEAAAIVFDATAPTAGRGGGSFTLPARVPLASPFNVERWREM